MSFLEVQFPVNISFGSQGGPGFQTNVRTINSGFEQRRIRWPYARHSYNVIKGVKTAVQLEELIEFFHAVQGKGYGFRYSDPLDHKTCSYITVPADDDQVIIADAVGGEQTGIQLIKNYTLGNKTVARPITKPIESTVLLALNGSPAPGGWTVDDTTGLVTLNSPLIVNDVLTWGGEFDVPCRFDTDKLNIRLSGDIVGDTEIPVIEIKV